MKARVVFLERQSYHYVSTVLYYQLWVYHLVCVEQCALEGRDYTQYMIYNSDLSGLCLMLSFHKACFHWGMHWTRVRWTPLNYCYGFEINTSAHWRLCRLFQTAQCSHQSPANTTAGTEESLEMEECQHVVSSQLPDRSGGCFMVCRGAQQSG